jgi:hypothetical protein
MFSLSPQEEEEEEEDIIHGLCVCSHPNDLFACADPDSRVYKQDRQKGKKGKRE